MTTVCVISGGWRVDTYAESCRILSAPVRLHLDQPIRARGGSLERPCRIQARGAGHPPRVLRHSIAWPFVQQSLSDLDCGIAGSYPAKRATEVRFRRHPQSDTSPPSAWPTTRPL